MNAVRTHRVIPQPLDGDPVECGALSLPVAPPSLNNLFVNGKKGRFKSPEYKTWQIKSLLHLRKHGAWHVPGAVEIKLTFCRGQTQADLDNLIKPTLDLLMAAGRIADDRNVTAISAAFVKGATGTRIEIRKAS